MNPILKSVAFLAVACAPSFAQLPPLLDRELFFGNPEYAGAQISPDGQYIAFLKPLNNTRNIWVKKTAEPFSAAKPVTNETKRPIPAFFWTRDGKSILFIRDNDGDENYNVWSADPAGQKSARNLTDAKGVVAFIYATPRNDPNTVYVGLNDRDKAWHDLYKLNLTTGERTLLRKNTDRISGWFFDNQGTLRLAIRSAENGDSEILRVDAAKFEKVYSCTVLETCVPIRFHKDGKRVYMASNKGQDLMSLVLFDPQTAKVEVVETDPLNKVDFGQAVFSEVTEELAVTAYEDERQRLYWKDKGYEADYKWLKSKLGDKEINIGARTRDENLWIVTALSDTEPGETYLFDRKNKKLDMQYKIREKLPREHLAKMQPVKYESSDGLEIPAYLTLPKGVEAKNLPVMIVPHGGPWARDSWGYSGFAQFLANRGYAVLQPNFRASTGYGRRFLDRGNKQWGDKMQDDITWGVKWLVAKGIADPKRVGIMGGSYGGYTTLAGVAFTPDLYKAAVAIVAPSNLITLLDSIPPYWEAGRTLFYERMGDPRTPEGKAQLMRQSPLNSAAKIKTPLMVVQGANDPRVNKAESDQIVIALRDRKFPVEYIVAPDEGHGFQRPVNNMAMFYAAENFLAKHLGGRAQTDAPADVSARLKEITVDPATVKLAPKVDASAVQAPTPTGALTPGTANYDVKIALGAQNLAMSVSSTIAKENGDWVLTETAKGPMGEASDRMVLDGKTLQLKKRTAGQGPMSIEVEVKDNKASGVMKAGGQDRPMNFDLGGPVYGDGAMTMQSISALPLADGYTVTLRGIDMMKQKPSLLTLKVAGSEQVTVPAGTFDAYKVEITSAEGGADKTTLWVAKTPRKTVKAVSVMPQMNGATLTAELK